MQPDVELTELGKQVYEQQALAAAQQKQTPQQVASVISTAFKGGINAPPIPPGVKQQAGATLGEELDKIPGLIQDMKTKLLNMDVSAAVGVVNRMTTAPQAVKDRLNSWTPAQRVYKDLGGGSGWLDSLWNEHLGKRGAEFVNDVVIKSVKDTGRVLGDVVWDFTGGLVGKTVKSLTTGQPLPLKEVLPGATGFIAANPELEKGYDAADKTGWGRTLSDVYLMGQTAAVGGAAVKALTAPRAFVSVERPLLGSANLLEAGKAPIAGSSYLSKYGTAIKTGVGVAGAAYGSHLIKSALSDIASNTGKGSSSSTPVTVTVKYPDMPQTGGGDSNGGTEQSPDNKSTSPESPPSPNTPTAPTQVERSNVQSPLEIARPQWLDEFIAASGAPRVTVPLPLAPVVSFMLGNGGTTPTAPKEMLGGAMPVVSLVTKKRKKR